MKEADANNECATEEHKNISTDNTGENTEAIADAVKPITDISIKTEDESFIRSSN